MWDASKDSTCDNDNVTSRLSEIGPAYAWHLSLGPQEYPHIPTHVFSAHFVLTHAHPGRTSQSVTHRSRPSMFQDGLPKKKLQLVGRGILSILLSLEPECHKQWGTTRLAADRGGLLQHGWNHLVRYNVGRRRGQHPWSSDSMVVAQGKKREETRLQRRFDVVSELWCGAPLLSILVASLKCFQSVSFVAGVVRPRHTREEESNGGSSEDPAR
jgi:hypothetical protein